MDSNKLRTGTSMTQPEPLISWHRTRESFLEHEQALPVDCLAEVALSGQSHAAGVCPVCNAATTFKVSSGAQFSGRPNLREGLVCMRCRLTARQRMLVMAFAQSQVPADGKGAVLERFSRLYRWLRQIDPGLQGSEYLGSDAKSGRYRLWRTSGRIRVPRLVRHESVTSMSFGAGSLKCLLHADVLEHVPDTQAALLECRRVLAAGAPMIFTVPFFTSQEATTIRGYHDDTGALVELLPGEYHGDGVRSGGIYTYYNFGWPLFELMRDVFSTAEIGVACSPGHGLVQACCVPGPWNMRSIVFRCRA